MKKKLYKSYKDKKVFGVCAGLANYLNIDPTIVRIIWAVLILACGTGLVAYIIAALIMDYDPNEI